MLSEFYLTKGSIEQLATKESLFGKASQSAKFDSVSSIRFENPTPILRLADFQHFTYCQQKGQRYGFVLTDGESEMTATIDKNLFHLVEDLDKNVNQFLRKGSVILLKKYKIVPLKDLLNDKEYEMEQIKEKRVLCITDLILLGHCIDSEEKQIERIKSSEQTENNQLMSLIDQSDLSDKIENFISQLDPSMNKSDWSIACKILAKTNVRQYENTKTGLVGRVQRFLLEDNSGLIELVVFNHFCDKEPVLKIELHKNYMIKNGVIRKSNSNLKAWSDRKSVDFEIQMAFKCLIYEYKGFLPEINKQNIKSVFPNEIDANKNTQNLSIKNLSNQTQDHPVVNADGQKLHEKFTKLNQLFYAKANSFVDVIGIVCEIGKQKKMNENSKLSLRNIKIIDEANIPISVAFWGKQAEDFAYPIGTCLLINKIKVTTYGGVSLSVMRITSLIEIKESYQISKANSLFSWWTQRNKTKIENNESDTDMDNVINKKQRIN